MTYGLPCINPHRGITAFALVLGLATANSALAQQAELYNDAWSEDTEIVEEDPPGWYWGYGSTGELDCAPGSCISWTTVDVTTRNPFGSPIAGQSGGGGGFSSAYIQPFVAAADVDGDYPMTATHDVRYQRCCNEFGQWYEDYNWWQFLKDQIQFKGINNRYVFSHFEAPNRWVFVRDECHATCQNDSQYITTEPDLANNYRWLHRKVKRVSIFGIGKCFNARLTLRNYRGVCTT